MSKLYLTSILSITVFTTFEGTRSHNYNHANQWTGNVSLELFQDILNKLIQPHVTLRT